MPKSISSTSATPADDHVVYDYDTDYDIYKTIYTICTKINLYLGIATIIVNLFHLIVLLQKELRLCAVYIFMIGVCISDIVLTSINFYNQAGELGWLPLLFAGSVEMSCLRYDYLEINIGLQLLSTISQITRRLSVWLAVLMAIIRLLSVTFPLSQRVKKLTSAKGAVITLMLCMMFWTLYSTWQFAFYRVFWLPDNANEICKSMFESFITPRYVLATPVNLPKLMSTWGFIEFIVNFSSAIIYPLLTISLLVALLKIKKRRQNNQRKESEPADNTTKLILFMTITFMLSEGLSGFNALLMYNITKIQRKYLEFENAVLTSEFPIAVLKTFNAFSHFFVCFFLSSQYRDVVKSLFISKKKKNQIDLTRSTSTITIKS
ncbi:G-protein coupled receptors family 1 profile domain-containing protein [Caenorhabditis elegans]|uniref:G-protein coupled receptors family 1 profile domain-containing protein n=1 Tax=Caenorhabditis elegans TaxID=6239 RepID=O17656_CAEEL|nr:G-protein coupled receptors family 1 profile domain-containing protein [Caenorhabditis elegans]CAB02828.1 G-protein coupled receptors family 1 profile domain-containing protein [Caenorhabditis elegans]|eukprot:NP_506766.1 Serpentine Receptor, class W [Caenorhabditis elegans]